MSRNKKNKDISTISFFSKKTKMENGEVISEEGGFYLEKTGDMKRLCYKKGKFAASMFISKKTFQKLKSLTSGVILERASQTDKLICKYDNDCMDDMGDYLDDYERAYGDYYKGRKLSYASHIPKEPKVIAPFIHQEFVPS